MQRIAVAGAGLGGLRAAEALRRAGFGGELIVVGAEPHLPYSRPPLSKDAMRLGLVRHERVAFRLRAAVAGVEWRLGVAVTGADLRTGELSLSDGARLGYDGLVIATGLRPRRLAVPGPPPGPGSGRYVLRTLDDAVALQAALRPGARVVVLGAGFIGCEIAATATELGCRVTCVALDVQPMIRPLGPMLGAELAHRHTARGTAFRLGTGIRAFAGAPRVHGVVLDSGERLAADLVVEAIGSHCNTEWLAGTGLDLADGVRCDNALRAVDERGRPVDRVVAVGDVARYPNPRFGDLPRRVEHWSNPTETAGRAGAVLAAALRGEGYEAELARGFAPVPSFWSDQFDIRLHAFGLPELAGDAGDAGAVQVLEGSLDGDVVVGYLRAGRLVGVVALGLLARAMSYRGEIGA